MILLLVTFDICFVLLLGMTIYFLISYKKVNEQLEHYDGKKRNFSKREKLSFAIFIIVYSMFFVDYLISTIVYLVTKNKMTTESIMDVGFVCVGVFLAICYIYQCKKEKKAYALLAAISIFTFMNPYFSVYVRIIGFVVFSLETVYDLRKELKKIDDKYKKAIEEIEDHHKE